MKCFQTIQVFPWVTICALINNVFEIRADAYKYCYVYRRSFSRQASNIGSWRYAFDILSSVSIVTNTAFIAMQPSVREYFSTANDVEYILMFVAAEVKNRSICFFSMNESNFVFCSTFFSPRNLSSTSRFLTFRNRSRSIELGLSTNRIKL